MGRASAFICRMRKGSESESVSGLLVCLSGGTEEGKECVDERDMDMENVVVKVPFQAPFSVAKIVIHMQGLHQTPPLP